MTVNDNACGFYVGNSIDGRYGNCTKCHHSRASHRGYLLPAEYDAEPVNSVYIVTEIITRTRRVAATSPSEALQLKDKADYKEKTELRVKETGDGK